VSVGRFCCLLADFVIRRGIVDLNAYLRLPVRDSRFLLIPTSSSRSYFHTPAAPVRKSNRNITNSWSVIQKLLRLIPCGCPKRRDWLGVDTHYQCSLQTLPTLNSYSMCPMVREGVLIGNLS